MLHVLCAAVVYYWILHALVDLSGWSICCLGLSAMVGSLLDLLLMLLVYSCYLLCCWYSCIVLLLVYCIAGAVLLRPITSTVYLCYLTA